MHLFILAGALAMSQTQKAVQPTPPELQQLARLVGGRWVGEAKGPDGNPFVEFVFTMSKNGLLLRGMGTVLKGTPQEFNIDSRIGWDPAKKRVYYADFHGSDTFYMGVVTSEKDGLMIDFEKVIGGSGRYVTHIRFPDKETYIGTIQGVKNGKLVGEKEEIHLRRVQS